MEVTLFNDMPGAYKDDLLVDVRGAPEQRLPVIADVRGCPLSLAKDCVGWTRFVYRQHCDGATINNGREAKSIRVVNDGPVDALVRWRQATSTGRRSPRRRGPEVDDDGVCLQARVPREGRDRAALDVEPREQLVPAHYRPVSKWRCTLWKRSTSGDCYGGCRVAAPSAGAQSLVAARWRLRH